MKRSRGADRTSCLRFDSGSIGEAQSRDAVPFIQKASSFIPRRVGVERRALIVLPVYGLEVGYHMSADNLTKDSVPSLIEMTARIDIDWLLCIRESHRQVVETGAVHGQFHRRPAQMRVALFYVAFIWVITAIRLRLLNLCKRLRTRHILIRLQEVKILNSIGPAQSVHLQRTGFPDLGKVCEQIGVVQIRPFNA